MGNYISCRNKCVSYMSGRGRNDSSVKLRYKIYCKILTDVTKPAKMCYGEFISRCKNKTKKHGKL